MPGAAEDFAPQEQVVIIPIEGTLGNPSLPPGTIEKARLGKS